MTADLSGHYRVVLDDLGTQRKRLAQELSDVDAAIAALQRRIGPAPSAPPADVPRNRPAPMPSPSADRPDIGIDYTKMSIRWAVLAFMSEVARGPLGTGAIASALEARGMTTNGPSKFGNLVSAVISNLRSKGEIDGTEGMYELTQAGRSMWAHIKASPKYRVAQSAESSEGTLLSEQD